MKISMYIDNSADYSAENPTVFDVVEAAWEAAKKNVILCIPVAEGVTRFVTIDVTTGVVSVEDVPQATGMDENDCCFICPPGRQKVEVPAGRWNGDVWEMFPTTK